jgi:hypothetical protein
MDDRLGVRRFFFPSPQPCETYRKYLPNYLTVKDLTRFFALDNGNPKEPPWVTEVTFITPIEALQLQIRRSLV